MSIIDFSGVRWRKSRRSNGQGSCIEVANVRRGQALAVAVRDSKDPGGPKLPVTREAWRAFIARVKDRDLGPAQARRIVEGALVCPERLLLACSARTR